jgi:hypothetical protein
MGKIDATRQRHAGGVDLTGRSLRVSNKLLEAVPPDRRHARQDHATVFFQCANEVTHAITS